MEKFTVSTAFCSSLVLSEKLILQTVSLSVPLAAKIGIYSIVFAVFAYFVCMNEGEKALIANSLRRIIRHKKV